ncbi:MAG: YhgE/Pip domain-containing protein [Coriobacteriia bacterium]
MRSLRLAALQLKRLFSDSLLVRAAVVAITLVPLLYGALYLWAFWDPYGNLDKMPVALINLDQPVSVDGELLSAGADLTSELVKAETFGYEQVSEQAAGDGVQSGRYYLSLTIPPDFSAKLATAKSQNPQRARLKVVAHESENMIASMIAERAFAEVRAAAGESASQGYLDKIFVGFSDAHGGFTDAALGAKDLASGLADARSGAKKLASGTSSASRGASTLTEGLHTLSIGAGKADAGATQLAGGTGSLAAGLTAAKSGAMKVAGGAVALDDGGAKLTTSLGTLSDGAVALASGADELSGGADRLKSGVHRALGAVDSAETASKQVSDGAAGLDSALNDYASAHPDAASDPSFAKALGISSQVKSGSAHLATGLKTASAQGPALGEGADQVAEGSSALAHGAKRLAGGLNRAHSGAGQLASGAHTLASGSTQLSSGVDGAADGATKLAAGSAALADGTHALSSGARTAAAGGGSLSVGIDRLDDGAHALAAGLKPAVSGSEKLASGLRDGAAKVPAYDTTLQARNAEMMSAPVALDTTKLGEVSKYGIGFAPYFIPLALWIGALLTFFITKPLSERALASGAPAPITALAGFLLASAIGLAQAVVLLLVVQFGLGLAPVQPLAFYGVGLVSALVFVAILQFLNAAFGAVGKLLSIVLMMLQLTSAAGTFPIQMVPGFFQALSPWMPMTYVVAALRQAISGGDLSSVAQSVWVLAVFGALSLLGTMLAARRGQVWTMERLHPSLVL